MYEAVDPNRDCARGVRLRVVFRCRRRGGVRHPARLRDLHGEPRRLADLRQHDRRPLHQQHPDPELRPRHQLQRPPGLEHPQRAALRVDGGRHQRLLRHHLHDRQQSVELEQHEQHRPPGDPDQELGRRRDLDHLPGGAELDDRLLPHRRQRLLRAQARPLHLLPGRLRQPAVEDQFLLRRPQQALQLVRDGSSGEQHRELRLHHARTSATTCTAPPAARTATPSAPGTTG